jgi:DNA-directed RNA polymerase subunit RPC12/RpoP
MNMKKIVRGGTDTYKATCHECGAVFTYQREDVHHNYIKGGEWVHCPHCGHGIMHFGASGSSWPCARNRSMTKFSWEAGRHEC